MSLLDRIRKQVRVTAWPVADTEGREPGNEDYVPTYSSPFDEELEMLIGAARRDLKRVGIREGLVDKEQPDADIEQCISLYVKCHFGYDNSEADRFGASYRMAVIDLMNSPANSSTGDIDPEEPIEPTDEEGPGPLEVPDDQME